MRYFLLTVALLCCLGCEPVPPAANGGLGNKYEARVYNPAGKLMSRIQFYSVQKPDEYYNDSRSLLYIEGRREIKSAPAGWYFDIEMIDDKPTKPRAEKE